MDDDPDVVEDSRTTRRRSPPRARVVVALLASGVLTVSVVVASLTGDSSADSWVRSAIPSDAVDGEPDACAASPVPSGQLPDDQMTAASRGVKVPISRDAVVCIPRTPPLDVNGSPMFPGASRSEVERIQQSHGGTAFIDVTTSTQAVSGSADDEYVVAHVRLHAVSGVFSYDAGDFLFTRAKAVGSVIEPTAVPFGALHALGAGRLHAGETIEGDVAFRAPLGGGDIYLDVPVSQTSEAAQTAHIDGSLVRTGGEWTVGISAGPWHVGS